jgi:hypothetical protein
MVSRPRIALVHGTTVAIDPIRVAFAEGWPDAEAVNILDDSLASDRATTADLTPIIAERIADLALYARKLGSHGILFTCSAFGSAIENAALLVDVPVLKPNEAMFERAIACGRNNALIVTFAPAKAGMEAEFREQAHQIDPHAKITSFLAEGAMASLREGDAETHNRLVANKAAELTGYDAVMLAHFSTAAAASSVRRRISVPVLTSPEAAVAKMRQLLS